MGYTRHRRRRRGGIILQGNTRIIPPLGGIVKQFRAVPPTPHGGTEDKPEPTLTVKAVEVTTYIIHGTKSIIADRPTHSATRVFDV